ncbi:MAG: glutamyl-tRNA reductase, partial [Acidobacteria bacterium]|nr:glutamyl-tRNA reductase [Acidobacteriota bacterium]
MSELPSHSHPCWASCPAPPGGLAALRARVITQRTVGVDGLRDLSIDCERALALHAELSARDIESFVLTTCNRTELYWRTRGPGDDDTVSRRFAQAVAAAGPLTSPVGVLLTDDAAARHLFRVCAGLDSLVLGEAEILGQVRAALDSCGGTGAFLRGVVQAALRAGRMVRAETTIGVGAMSVASAAVHLLARRLPLAGARVAVLGAGDTGLKAARHLRARGIGTLVVANRTLARAEQLAHALAGHAITLDAVAGELLRADAVVCAVAAPAPLIRAADLERAAAARGGRPLVIVDLSMPAAVERADAPGVTCIDLAAIETQVAGERHRRSGEVPRAEAVVARELTHLHTWSQRHARRPLVAAAQRQAGPARPV